MLYLDYAKQMQNGYILNFFADNEKDIEEVSGGKEFVTRNGVSYGSPLAGSTIVITNPDKTKTTFVLNDNGEWKEPKIVAVNNAYTGYPWLDPRAGSIGLGLEDRGGWQTVTVVPEWVEGMRWYGSLDENKTYLAICSNNRTSGGIGDQEIYQHVFTCKMKRHKIYDIYFLVNVESENTAEELETLSFEDPTQIDFSTTTFMLNIGPDRFTFQGNWLRIKDKKLTSANVIVLELN